MKHYEKPQLFMEEFTLNEHIAQCSVNHDDGSNMIWEWIEEITPKHYADSCYIEVKDPLYGDGIVKLFGNRSNCETIFGQDDYYIEGCYQGVSGDGNLEFFGS